MIERLFTSKNRVKLLRFFLFEQKEAHLRGISKELEISVSAVKREIDNLKEIGILKQEGARISINDKCNFINDLKNIFIKTDAIIYPLKDVLKSKKIKYALVFGSFAKASYNPESDVDLLIIGEIKLSDVYDLLKSAEGKIKREINPVVWSEKDLSNKKNTGFVRDIFTKKIIMLKGDENELRKAVRS